MTPVRLQAADLQLDLVRHEARRGDHLLQLTRRSFPSWNIFAGMPGVSLLAL